MKFATMENKHKYAVCYTTYDNGKEEIDTCTLADPLHRKELLARCAAVAVGELAVKRFTIDFND